MDIDLRTLPYSCRGSYLVISEVGADWCASKNEPGLYLRTVHSTAAMPLIARLLIGYQGQPAKYTSELQGACLALDCGGAKLEVCFPDTDTLLIRGGKGLDLTLDFMSDRGAYDYIYPFSRLNQSYLMANCFKNRCRLLMRAEEGEARLEQEWQDRGALYTRLRLSGKDGFLLSLREIQTEWDGRPLSHDFDQSRKVMDESLSAFARLMPSCPPEYASTVQKAAYLLWTSYVHKDGLLPREAMLMSKNWMKNVWSWDHCFNAIALSWHAPDLAWDQFMILFDCQDPTGLLPDSVNDANMVWNFCKPPIHGWALRRMMTHMELTPEQLSEAYRHLSLWTDWWLNCRDYDGDGLCEYTHGNDSGWDNSTAFSVLPPIATPDLQAFLIIQMDVLADLAQRLGQDETARLWAQRSDRLLERLVGLMFADGLPVALQSGSHEPVPNDSLLPYLCILLGEKLPQRIRQSITGVLSGDKFKTSKGFATESPRSPFYISDGYWRGPIWAPSTMLLVDGLAACGETALVREIVTHFAEMVSASGFAENFDAQTGAGLRDRAYTWTASAFLAMAHDYL